MSKRLHRAETIYPHFKPHGRHLMMIATRGHIYIMAQSDLKVFKIVNIMLMAILVFNFCIKLQKRKIFCKDFKQFQKLIYIFKGILIFHKFMFCHFHRYLN
jgi:hypothetical protein